MESALSYNNINKYIRLFLIYKIYTNIQQITNIRSLCELRTSRRQRSCNFASKEAIRILIDKLCLSTENINRFLYIVKFDVILYKRILYNVMYIGDCFNFKIM